MSCRERGQAILETAIFAPLFFGLLAAVIWATREVVLQERMQSGLRYGGMIAARATAFDDIGVYAMYNNLHQSFNVGTPAGGACIPLTDDALFSRAQSGQTSPTFYNPTKASTAGTVCTKAQYYGHFSSAADVIVLSVTSKLPATSINTTSVHALGNLNVQQSGTAVMFRQPDAQTIMRCFPDIDRVVGNSLDPGSPAAIPAAHGTAPLVAGFAPPYLNVAPGCVGGP